MSSILTLNGTPINDLDLYLSGIGDMYSSPSLDRQEIGIPGRYGAIPLGGARGRSLRIPLVLVLMCSVAERMEKRDRIVRHLRGQIEVQWSDRPGRRWWAVVDDIESGPLFNSMAFVHGELSFPIDLVLHSPVGEDVEITSRFLPAETPVYFDADDLGTEPSPTLIVVPGAALSYRCEVWADGVEQSALQIKAGDGPGASEHMELDGEARRIVVEGTGFPARNERYDLYGDGDFPVLEPDRSDTYLLASHNSTVYYRRLWR